AAGGVDLGGVGLELHVPLGLAEGLDLRGVGLALLVEEAGLAVAGLADDLVAGGPARQPLQHGAGVAEGHVGAREVGQLLGAAGEPAVEAEAVIGVVAAQPAGGAAEGGAQQADGARGSQELTRAGALVAAGVTASTATGRAPFSSSRSMRCCRAAA